MAGASKWDTVHGQTLRIWVTRPKGLTGARVSRVLFGEAFAHTLLYALKILLQYSLLACDGSRPTSRTPGTSSTT
eukprot:453311-Prymnesium_polylepis.1